MSNIQNNIIPITAKQTLAFNNHLASLARSDAHHDLKKEFTETMYNSSFNIKQAFNSGIPVASNTAPVGVYHEASALAASIIRAGPIGGSPIDVLGNESSLKTALAAVPPCTNDANAGFHIFEVGFDRTKLFDYRVVKFVIKCSNNAASNPPIQPYIGADFGKTFVTNTNLGGEKGQAALIVDFSQHHFMQSLVQGVKDNAFTVHYLMTPEVVNDPAGKPNIHNQSLFGSGVGGVNLISYIQAGDSPTSYTSYDVTNPSPANNFFSRYNFTLSPIKQTFIKGKAENLITTLDIDYDDKQDKPPLTDTITDSKGENSVTSVLGYLKDVIKKINKWGTNGVLPFNRVDAFSFNSKCQQKRGGDWFQVLSCLDAKNRNFTQILPNLATGDAAAQKIPPCPVYLVTHDQIAVSYALLNGVNVIYIDYYGTIYVFKNTGDSTTLITSGKTMEQILFEGIKQKWILNRSTINPFPLINQLLRTCEQYTAARTLYFKGNTFSIGIENQFKTTCQNIIRDIQPLTTSKDLGNIQKGMTSNMQRLFREAVVLMFSQLNLLDISSDCRYVSENKHILDNNYDISFNAQINNLNSSINNIQSVQNRFGNIAATVVGVSTDKLFTDWITITVSKLDVYKTANNILTGGNDEDTPPTFFLTRLVNFLNTSGTEERKTDSHIFLPFIQSLDIASRNSIKNVLQNAIVVTENYSSILSATPARTSRTGKMSPSQLYFNKLGNLIQEALIFVITDNTTENDYNNEIATVDKTRIANIDSDSNLITDGMSSFESTDSLLLQTDWDELVIFFTDDLSKSSNYASESPLTVTDDIKIVTDDIKYGGTVLSYYGQEKKRKKNVTTAFCDVSVKQITWPLITSVLLNSAQNTHIIDIFIARIQYYIAEYVAPEGQNLTGDEMITTERDINNQTINLLEQKPYNPRPPLILPPTKKTRYTGGDLSNSSDELSIDESAGVTMSLSELATRLYDIHSNKNNNNILPNSNTDLMLDTNLGFHPLVPIYAMLAPFFSTLGPKAAGDPFFYTYFTYINILEKMKSVIETKYLNNTNNPAESASAYLIGFGLNTMLIKSHTSILQNNEILKVLDMSQQEYFEFSLKNDSFGGLFSGSVSQDTDEEAIGISLINNELFTNFINNEVNIKEILQTGTPVINLPNYEVLKERIFKIMGEIVVKVNADRGTPITNTVSVSSGIAEQGVAAGIPEKREVYNFKPYEPYESTVAPKKQPTYDYRQLNKPEKAFENTNMNQSLIRGYGGKTKKNKKGAKHKKSRKSKKTIKKKTRKHSKKNNKNSRKH
jgi:hypothetical protein